MSEEYGQIWKRIGEGIGKDLLRWLQTNYQSFQNVDELLDNPKLETLSQKEAKRVKEILKHLYEVKSAGGSKKNSQYEELINQAFLSPEERLSAKIFPLITCFEVDENSYVVEKFQVREDYVKELCNLIGPKDAFYTDTAGGINLEFGKLQSKIGDPFGVLGKINQVEKFFQQILSQDSLNALWQYTEKEGSGMYLILPDNVITSDERSFYLYFYSEKDEDYDNVGPKSRAVHFIRYVTQLSGKLVLLIDDEDAEALSKRVELKRDAANRVVEYHIGQTQTQEEEVKTAFWAKSPLPEEKSDTLILQGSTNCLLAVQTLMKKSETTLRTKKIYLNISYFHENFQLTDISDDIEICEEFIEDYLREYDKATMKNIAEQLAEKEKSLMENENERKFLKMTDFSMITLTFQNAFSASFKVLMCCIKHSKGFLDDKQASWDQCFAQMESLQSMMSPGDIESFQMIKNDSIEHISEMLQRICLCGILNYDSVDLSVSFGELFSKAWKAKCFGATKSLKLIPKTEPNHDADVVLEAYSKLIKKLFGQSEQPGLNKNVKAIKEALISQAKILVEKLEELATAANTTHELNLKAEYVCLRKKLFRESIQLKIMDERKLSQRNTFHRMVANARTESTKTKEANAPKRKPILSIENLHKAQFNGTAFLISFQEEEINSPKTQIIINKLSLAARIKEQGQTGSSTASSEQSIKFVEVFRGGVPPMDVIRVFLLDDNKFLLAANDGKVSRIMIINFHNGSTIQKQDFRQPISLCDYDVDSRIICLFSVSEVLTELVTYRFSYDFKTREGYSTLNLVSLHDIRELRGLCLQPKSEYVWLLKKNGGDLLRLSIRNGASTSETEIRQALHEVHKIVGMRFSPKGDCLFLDQGNGKTIPYMTQSQHVLPALDIAFDQVFGLIGHRNCYFAALKGEKEVIVTKATIQGSQSELFLEENMRTDQRFTNFEHREILSKHWIHYLYCIYMKFSCGQIYGDKNLPITLIAMFNKKSSFIEKALKEALTEIHFELRNKRKPLDLFEPEALMLSQEHGCHLKVVSDNNPMGTTFGDLMQKLIMLTPVQIARCISGQFFILRNGRSISTNNIDDIFEMQNKINLGLLEAVFRNWQGPVVVVSTMGKQSTGKSYLLNHLFETSFDISGSRCTDGCWITTNTIGDSLFVILDFEGLGTFERSDEEDMLLSLFNSALSLMTLYKTEKRIDRETDVLFSKFNLGIDHIKGDDNLFQGCFCIIVNDVAEQDSRGVKTEIHSKLWKIINRDRSNNFISKLYRDKVQIRFFSLFETDDFYADIAQLLTDIRTIQPVFKNGSTFLDTMKLLLAKLTLGDFTPLTRQYVDGRIKFLRSNLERVFIFGQLAENKEKLPDFFLRNLNDRNTLIESEWLPPEELKMGRLDDMDFVWSEDEGFDEIVQTFCQAVVLNNTSFHQLWRNKLEGFMDKILENRVTRVKLWVNKNLETWLNKQNQDYDDAIAVFLDELKFRESSFRARNLLCSETCSKCYLKCILNKLHKGGHICSTNHNCSGQCEFCLDASRPCQEIAGHEGRHFCRDGGHTCGHTCSFVSKNGCKRLCRELPNHGSDHKCGIQIHTCNSPCSLHRCPGNCNIECTIPHTVHKCPKNVCVEMCCIDTCHNPCISKDHFHGSINLRQKYNAQMQEPDLAARGEKCPSDAHYCGNEHHCSHECSQEGFCNLSTERTEFDKEFYGKRSTFKYRKRLTNVGQKLPCLVKIPPFRTEHSGDHWCTTNTESKVHTCKTRCPQCDNLCTKPVDHDISSADVLHRTSHGNMVNYVWLSTNETFEFDNHELEAGESTEIIFCHACCIRQGRGHTHIVDCPGQCENKFSAKTDHRRHDFRKWLPDKHRQRDEIWHRDYWKLHGFENPCSEAETKAFEKCYNYCGRDGHDELNRSYCVLGLWHDPVKALEEANLTRGWVSNEGHAFSCTH